MKKLANKWLLLLLVQGTLSLSAMEGDISLEQKPTGSTLISSDEAQGGKSQPSAVAQEVQSSASPGLTTNDNQSLKLSSAIEDPVKEVTVPEIGDEESESETEKGNEGKQSAVSVKSVETTSDSAALLTNMLQSILAAFKSLFDYVTPFSWKLSPSDRFNYDEALKSAQDQAYFLRHLRSSGEIDEHYIEGALNHYLPNVFKLVDVFTRNADPQNINMQEALSQIKKAVKSAVSEVYEMDKVDNPTAASRRQSYYSSLLQTVNNFTLGKPGPGFPKAP